MAWSTRPELQQTAVRFGLLLVALTSAFYVIGLDRWPVAIGGDEVHFAIHADAISRTGHDLNGRLLPLFVRISDPLVPNQSSWIWYQPFLFYVMAPFVRLFGVGEWPVRLPVALIAIADVWLTYAVARRLFPQRLYAVAAALMLALTPAHVIVARQGLDYVAPLPFVLGWLLFVLRYLDQGDGRNLAISGLLLGAGLFSYIAAWVLMPLYFALTVWALARGSSPGPGRAVVTFACAFAVPCLALGIALLANPEFFANTLARYDVNGNSAPASLASRIILYWDYFNPSFLFFAGGANPTQATGRVGVFLIGLLPLIAIGLRDIAQRREPRWMMVAIALLVAPFPIAITMPPAAAYSIARAMTLLPCGVLIAVHGLETANRSRVLRLVALAAVASIPLQFALFARDYLGDYQQRAAPRLDPANMRGVATAVIAENARSPVPTVYLSHALDDGGARWRFFMLASREQSLLARSHSVNLTENPPVAEPGAIIVCYASDPKAAALVSAGYRVVATVADGAGTPASVVLKAPG